MAPAKQESNHFWGFPVTALDIINLANASREQQAEKAHRQRLAKGIPHNAPACQKHRRMLEPLSQTSLDGTMAGLDADEMDESIVVACQSVIPLTTALLPHCSLCFYKASDLASIFAIPEDFDGCLCASALLTSDCIYCSLAALEQKLSHALGERTRHDVANAEFLACECGSQVMFPGDVGELVRKCIGCGGVVTAPFRNWKGEELVFGRKTTLPALIIDGDQRLHELDSLEQRKLGVLQPSRETVDVLDPRLRQTSQTEETTTAALPEIEKPSLEAPIAARQRTQPSRNSHINLAPRTGQRSRQQTANRRGRSDSGTAVAPLKDITNQAFPSRRCGLNGLGKQKGT